MDGHISFSRHVQGTCTGMCPEEEMKLREKEHLIHILEMARGSENSKSPIPDRNLMVKSFSRSAAGKASDDPKNLRPPDVLLRTVSYLLFDIIDVTFLPWHRVYDFITDRLMAVRQDMVIQNLPKEECIAILQPIVRFHAYAGYRLCSEHINHFDPVLNKKHLQECLKKLLYLYDQILFDKNLPGKTSAMCYDYYIETRAEFEAMYVILNLGNEEALQRTFVLEKQYKTQDVKNALEISLCFKYGNFVRLCRLIKYLPTLLSAMVALHLPEIRQKALQVMSIAYNNKQFGFHLKDLKAILLYGSDEELLQDCKHCKIEVIDHLIYFSKQSFICEESRVSSTPKHAFFVEKKLSQQSLQSLLLNVPS